VAAIADRFDDETVLYWHTLSNTDPPGATDESSLERLPASYRRHLDRSG
jgi:hypothetical protein